MHSSRNKEQSFILSLWSLYLDNRYHRAKVPSKLTPESFVFLSWNKLIHLIVIFLRTSYLVQIFSLKKPKKNSTKKWTLHIPKMSLRNHSRRGAILDQRAEFFLIYTTNTLPFNSLAEEACWLVWISISIILRPFLLTQ